LERNAGSDQKRNQGSDSPEYAPIHRYLTDYPLKVQHILFSNATYLFNGLSGKLVGFLTANNVRMSDLLHDLKYIPFWFVEIAEQFNYDQRTVTIEEVRSAIEYLKKRNKLVYRQSVADLMGIFNFNPKKRRDISKLFNKVGRFYLAA